MKSIFEFGVAEIKDLSEQHVAELEISEIRELNLKGIHDEASLHDALARLLRFPDFYGKNIDALNDMLKDLPDEARIVVKVKAKEWRGIKGSFGFESSFKWATRPRMGSGYGQGKILLLKI